MKKNIITILILMVLILSGVVIYLYRTNLKNTNKSNEKREIITNNTNDKSIFNDKNLSINNNSYENKDNFVNYLENVNNEVDKVNDENILKNTFITLTDFIFYDREIKKTKFKDLTSSVKEKVLNIYEEIDSKIENKFPGYKENIKSNSLRTYNNIKGKLDDLRNNILNNYKNSVGEDEFNDTIDSFNEGKESMNDTINTYKPYVEEGKAKAKEYIAQKKDELNDWYQQYKNS